MHSLLRLSVTSLLSASALLAQGTLPRTEEEPVSLENFVVTAHPYGRAQTDLAQPTSVLTGTALTLKQSNSLGELLGNEAGVSSSYFGPGASRPIIRGLAGDRVRILENSVGLIDASVSSPDHAVSLDPLLIERVEVVRGPASLLYGNAVVGGVVNVITHRIHTHPPESVLNGRTEVRASSVNNELAGGLLLEGQSGFVAWHLDGYRRTANDVDIPGFAESAARRAEEAEEAAEHGEAAPEEIHGRIPNTSLVADGGAFGLTLLGSAGYVGFSFNGHNTLYGVPTGAHEHHHSHEDEESHAEDAHGEAAAPVSIDLRQRRFDLQAEITRPFGAFTGAKFKFGSAQYRHQELEGAEVGTVYTNRGYDGRLELLHTAMGPFTGAIGAQASISRFSAEGEEAFVPSSKTVNRALFLFEEASWGPTVWQFGARAEQQEITLTDGSGLAIDDDTASVSGGLIWPLSDTWTLSTSLAHTERAPNTQERFSNGPHIGTNAYEIGDPDLGHETSFAIDLSLRKRTGMVTGALTVFANQFDGYIYEQATGDEQDELDVYTYVQRDARLYGVELESIIHLHESERHRFDIQVGADLVRGRNTDDDTELPRITPARARLGFTWVTGPFSLTTDLQRVATQDRVAPNESATGAHTVLNASAGYRFTLGRLSYDLFVRGSNLGNEEIRLHTSFLKEVAPLPGRNVTIGLRTSF
ncbi:TonB-dependent receptor [Opitutaceae bacterium]